MRKLRVPNSLIFGGEFRFSQDTLLYADQNFAQFTQGGLTYTELNAQFINVGWTKSPQYILTQRLKKKTTEISKACQRPEVVLIGHPSFFSKDDELSQEQALFMSMTMEGNLWTAAVICTDILNDISEMKTLPWCLAYFKKDAFIYPAEYWQKITQPIYLYGDIAPVDIMTEVGRVNCFLRVRGAAFLLNR